MKIYQHYSIYGFSNAYIVANDETAQAIIIDPSEITVAMVDQIENHHYSLEAVLITHNHIHHIRGLSTLLRIYSPPVFASDAHISNISCHKVKDETDIPIAGLVVRALAVPGHSQDSIVYKIEDALFTGDALHAGIIGKTTSTFNTEALIARIRSKLLRYPDETMVFPGHGPPSTVWAERMFNLGLQEGYVDKKQQPYDFFV